MKKVFPFSIGILVLALGVPVITLATQSGGGYTVYDQVSPIKGFATGGAYSTVVGGHPITKSSTGNGITVTGDIYSLGVTGTTLGTGGGGGGSDTYTYKEKTKKPNCKYADLNCDGRVTSVDLSILLYYFDRPINNDYDLNNDGKIDIVDVSILYYYWS
jgi:hypothetical protein